MYRQEEKNYNPSNEWIISTSSAKIRLIFTNLKKFETKKQVIQNKKVGFVLSDVIGTFLFKWIPREPSDKSTCIQTKENKKWYFDSDDK